MPKKFLPEFSIAISFGSIGLLMAGLFMLIMYEMESTNMNIDSIVGQNMRKIEMATKMRESLNSRQIALRDFFMQSDFFERDEKKMVFYAQAINFVDARDAFNSMQLDENEKIMLKNIHSIASIAYPLQNEMVELGMSEAEIPDISQRLNEVLNVQTNVKEEINKLLEYQRSEAQQASRDAKDTYQNLRYLLLFLGGGTIVIIFVIAWTTINHTRLQTRKIAELARFPNENPSPVLRVNMDGKILFANSASYCFLQEWQCNVGDSVPRKWRKIISNLGHGESYSEFEVKCNEKIYALNLTYVPSSSYVNFYGKDITERETMKRRIAFQASHDSLTGLINRYEFEKRLQQLIDDALSEERDHALLYCDLDQFKVVNDSCGHVAGDKLLKQITSLMKRKIRSSDVLARLGGDEFGVLLHSCNLGKAREIAELLRLTVKDFRYLWENKTFEIGASIGVVPITPNSGKMADILAAADSACYVAKERGRNNVYTYQDSDAAIVEKRSEMNAIHQINNAIKNKKFYLDYQIISPFCGTSKPETHVEVLLRMLDGEGKRIPPGAFIPAAERYDLMPTIDRWVVNTCINTLNSFYSSNTGEAIICSINLSGQSIGRQDFLSYLLETIIKSEVPPEYLCFEITETAAIANIDCAAGFIDELKGIGCRFALDDFGSGLSSFNYLKTLGIDYLKIDGSFVKDILKDPIDRAIVQAINTVGHQMGIKTIAEYVETTDIAKVLKEMGVDYGQGFGLHVPESFELMLNQYRGHANKLKQNC